MNRMYQRCACVTSLLVSASAFAGGGGVIERFDRPQLDRWVCLTEEHTYEAHFENGVMIVHKHGGLEDGLVRLNGTFEVDGDFIAHVTAHRDQLDATGEMGIVCYYRSGRFNDIFFNGSDFINANVFQIDGGFETRTDTATTVELFIRRFGDRVTLGYSKGENEIILHEHIDPLLTGPVRFGLFLESEYQTTADMTGWFDDWITYADVLTPTGCVADFDDGTFQGRRDCAVTIDDLLYYLNIFANGSPDADLDDGSFLGTPDGGVTVEDLLFFLDHYYAGC